MGVSRRSQLGKEETILNEKTRVGTDRKKWEELFHGLSYPFPTLMIDQVIEIERGKSLKSRKWVTMNEFFLTGHFPGEPIMPGVLTLEGMIQSALILVGESLNRGRVQVALEKVERVRFKRAIVPGDAVEFGVTLMEKKENLWKFKGKAQCGEKTAAEAEFFLKVAVREVGFEI